MSVALVVAVVAVALAVIVVLGRRVVRAQRETFIRTYMFPRGLIDAPTRESVDLPSA